MKILINGLQISRKNSGVQYYALHLSNYLLSSQKLTGNQIILAHRSSLPLLWAYMGRIGRILYENIIISRRMRSENFHIYHSPNYVLPYFLNFNSVVTIHDLITFDFPLLCQMESVIYFRWLLPRSIRKASAIIAVSNTVKSDIIARFNVPHDKITVIYHGINSIFKKITCRHTISTVKLKYHLPDRYILFVGNIEPKKNIEFLIKAFAQLRKKTTFPHKLVIVGKNGWKYKSVYEAARKSGLDNEILFTGYVEESHLPAVYSAASLFVFPSIYEGFGLPPLEAMACEVPVIVSNRGALPEVTGGKCLQVDPYDIDGLTESMRSILANDSLRQSIVRKSKEWADNFSWESTSEKTALLYQNIFSTPICIKTVN